jgi:hypothetical protein
MLLRGAIRLPDWQTQRWTMTRDEKLRLAVSVARAAARSGEYRRIDKLIEVVFRKLEELAPTPDEDEAERGFEL